MKKENKVPKGMKELHGVMMKCIAELVSNQGYKLEDAEKMVMATLHESDAYLKKGLFAETTQAMKMIYLTKF